MTHSVIRIDKGLEEEAKRIAEDGIFVGLHLNEILNHFDRRGVGLPISRLQDLFDEILEGICEALYGSVFPDEYNIVYHAACFHYRPGAQPSREKLDDSLEAYAQISDEDLAAEEGENP